MFQISHTRLQQARRRRQLRLSRSKTCPAPPRSHLRRQKDQCRTARRDSHRLHKTPSDGRLSRFLSSPAESGPALAASCPTLLEIGPYSKPFDSRGASQDKDPCQPPRASWRNRPGRQVLHLEYWSRTSSPRRCPCPGSPSQK